MKSVSKKYKSSMCKTLRGRSHCAISFGNTDVTAITDGVWSGDENQYSSFSNIDYEHNFGNTIASLELNRWVLDGSNTIEKHDDGFISYEYMVYQQGSGGSVCPQSIIKRFETLHTLSGITLTFDTRENEWPFKVVVSYYKGVYETELETHNIIPIVDENGNQISALISYGTGGLVATTTVYPTSNVCLIPLAGTDVDIVMIQFCATLPSRRPRLEHVSWGVATAFNDNKLISVVQSHDVDPISRRLPQETLEFTVEDYAHSYDPDNPEGVYAYISKGAPVSISYGYDVDGETEWIKPDSYSLSDIPVFRNNQVTFKCVGLVGTMNRVYYKDTYNSNGKTLYSLAQSVLADSGLPLTPSGNNPWNIDASLQTMFTTAVLPIDTHANLLQLIAHAARCRLYTDDDNIIHIKPFGVTPVGIFDGVYTDSGHIQQSEWGSVDNGNSSSSLIASLELNGWVLDGNSFVNLGNNGYVGNQMSESDGDTSSYWCKVFNVSHDLPMVEITFDETGNTWPFKISVQYYGENGIISTVYAYPSSASATVNTAGITDCTWIKVTACSLLPCTRPRVTKVAFRETDFSINLESCTENTLSTSKIEKLRNINVSEYKYSKKNESSVLYEADTSLTDLHIEYNCASDITVTVTGGTVTSQNVYSRACDLVMGSGTKHIVVTGYEIEDSCVVHSTAVNTSGDDDPEDNMLITNSTMADALSSHIASYLALRNTYDLSYRGNPELEVGDIIELETLYSKVVYGLMLTDEIRYNGALSGRVKVKGLC